MRRSHICESFKNASLEYQQSRWKKFDSGVSCQQKPVLGLGACVGASGAAPAHVCLDRHSEELITCVITLQLPPFNWRGSRSTTLCLEISLCFLESWVFGQGLWSKANRPVSVGNKALQSLFFPADNSIIVFYAAKCQKVLEKVSVYVDLDTIFFWKMFKGFYVLPGLQWWWTAWQMRTDRNHHCLQTMLYSFLLNNTHKFFSKSTVHLIIQRSFELIYSGRLYWCRCNFERYAVLCHNVWLGVIVKMLAWLC